MALLLTSFNMNAWAMLDCHDKHHETQHNSSFLPDHESLPDLPGHKSSTQIGSHCLNCCMALLNQTDFRLNLSFAKLPIERGFALLLPTPHYNIDKPPKEMSFHRKRIG